MNIKKRNSNRKTLFVSSVGGMLEFYDFTVFLMLSPILAHFFFAGSGFFALLSTYIIFATGYFVRPIGGIILGHFGDKFGRKPALLFSIFLMSFSTLAIACLPNSGVLWTIAPFLLMVLRICQGFAVGGVLPASVTFAFETLPKKKRLSGCALIVAGNGCGILLAAFTVATLSNYLSESAMLNWGWRPPFLIGALIGSLGIYLRHRFTDTIAFKRLAFKKLLVKVPLFELAKTHLLETILCCILSLLTSIMLTTLIFMFPLLLHSYQHFPLNLGHKYSMFFLLLLVGSSYLFPLIIEKLKRQPIIYFAISIFIICLLVFPLFYSIMIQDVFILVVSYSVICIATGIWTGIIPYILASCFAAKIRFTGFSTSYNLGLAAGGGITPLIITLLAKNSKSVYSVPMFLFVSGICCIMILIILMIRYEYNLSKHD